MYETWNLNHTKSSWRTRHQDTFRRGWLSQCLLPFDTKLATRAECLSKHGQSSAWCTSLCYTFVQICLDHNKVALSAILLDRIAMADICGFDLLLQELSSVSTAPFNVTASHWL
jgi:hypothetical protein